MQKLLKEKPEPEPPSLPGSFMILESPFQNTSWVQVPSDPYRIFDPLTMGGGKTAETKAKKRARR